MFSLSLARNILRHKRKQLGPRHLPMEVPEMSLSSSGYVVHHELGRGGQGAVHRSSMVKFSLEKMTKTW